MKKHLFPLIIVVGILSSCSHRRRKTVSPPLIWMARSKVVSITKEIGKVPVITFGNSGGDEPMHNFCLSNPKYRTVTFMLVADDDARDHADLAEGAKREAKWRKNGYTVISMKNDFKTIYGPGVQKTDFIFK